MRIFDNILGNVLGGGNRARKVRPSSRHPIWGHKTVIKCIEQAPAFNVELFRIYNLALRMTGSSYRTQTYFGSTMICDPRDYVQRMILHFGIWEPNTSAVIEKLLSPGDLCVDVGANIGYDTLLASHLVGPRGLVIGIEASPSIFTLLSRNAQENHASNIRLVNKAVSDRAGKLDIYSGLPDNIGRTTTLPSSELQFETSVEALPLDQILSTAERSRVRLIKIDIEGGEAPVMRRFLDTLHLYPASVNLIVEVARSDEWSDIFASMRSEGFSAHLIENPYDTKWYISQRDKLTPLQPINKLPEYQSDILFTRGLAPVVP